MGKGNKGPSKGGKAKSSTAKKDEKAKKRSGAVRDWGRGSGGRMGGAPTDVELRTQLHHLGLRVKEVAADGNCFFRALSDQRWGGEEHHVELRKATIAYMEANREDFEPFIEDDEKWDAYIERMAEDGTWAGNMELQAASLACMANICVHQAGQPRWDIVNYKADRWFHVTYEGSEHYNSTRLVDHYYEDDEPSGPISLLRDPTGRASLGVASCHEPSAAAVAATVARAGGLGKKTRARELLRLMDGCVDSAALALKAEVSYRGTLRGQGGSGDPVPGQSTHRARPEEEALGSEDAARGRSHGENEPTDGGSGGDEEGSEDDWEPVVTKRGKGGAKRGGRRRGYDEPDSLDARVASLRI